MSDPIINRLQQATPPELGDAELTALLDRTRARVDHERASAAPLARPRLRPRTRLALVAAAAAVITAVPVVISVVAQDEAGGPLPGLSVAVAQNGEFACTNGYASVVDPADADVRLLPDALPPGWDYTQIFVRHERSLNCDAQSLVALQLDPTGVVTARLAVTGPVDAYINTPVVDRDSVPDTVFGEAARRFDYSPDPARFIDNEIHRWVWTDADGRQWSAEAVGLDLEAARRQLAGVTVDEGAIAWQAVDPTWTLIHLRTGAPYDVPSGGTIWTVQATGGLEGTAFDVYSNPEPHLPVAADAWIGDQLIELAGRPAVVSPVRGTEAAGGPPGSPGYVTIGVDIEPGVTALSRFAPNNRPAVETMLASLRQVPSDDARIQTYGEN